MNKLVKLSCSTAAGFLLATGSVSADASNDARYAGNSLEGAWEVITTVRVHASDCRTAPLVASGPNPFPAFNTFHEGGTMSEWGSRSPPANRSSGHGVWERVGARKFAYRLQFHSFDNGLLSATMDIKTKVQLARNGETFTGVSRFVRTDLSGNALNFCATMEGRRISL